MSQYSSQPLVALRTEVALEAREQRRRARRLLRFWQALQQLQRVGAPVSPSAPQELRRTCQQACELHGIDVELVGTLPPGPP
jgi:hypothetical protein